MENREQLNLILKEYIEDFVEKSKDDELKIVKNSIPIVWFGDMEEYFKSKYEGKRIVTIAANPSDKEFPCDEKRFKIIDFKEFLNLNEDEQLHKIDELRETLNEYFRKNPYMSHDDNYAPSLWFDNYQKILGYIGASYKLKKDNKYAVLHIDAYTANATDPTWSRLSPDAKKKLKNVDLFKKLFAFLNPDIILLSIDQKYFNDIVDILKNEEKVNFVREYHRKNIERVEYVNKKGETKRKIISNQLCIVTDYNEMKTDAYVRVYDVNKGNRKMVWGKCNITPFRALSDMELEDIMKAEFCDEKFDENKKYKENN